MGLPFLFMPGRFPGKGAEGDGTRYMPSLVGIIMDVNAGGVARPPTIQRRERRMFWSMNLPFQMQWSESRINPILPVEAICTHIVGGIYPRNKGRFPRYTAQRYNANLRHSVPLFIFFYLTTMDPRPTDRGDDGKGRLRV